MLPEHQEAFQNILDCFTGADGGVAFVNLQNLVSIMDEQAHDCSNKAGNDAYQVLACMRRFSKLIEIANRPPDFDWTPTGFEKVEEENE